MKRALLPVAALTVLLATGCSWFKHGISEPGFKQTIIDHVWTLENPPAPGTVENPLVQYWRQRYEGWRAGTLSNYPFESFGTPVPPVDSTPMGQTNARGEMMTEPSIQPPLRSIHETEPWGDDGGVWPVLNQWSLDWERRYADWIEATASPTFLTDNGVPVDCSDAPYVYRWIFARINHLPQGAHLDNGNVWGNWNLRFKDLPTAEDWRDDQRFHAALDYVQRNYIRGKSIPFDTYPIDIRPAAGMLHPGTLAADKVHVRFVHRIIPSSSDPVRQLSGTQPREMQTLADETLSDVIYNDGAGWGMVNFSWWDYDFALHRYRCVPDRLMPGFSLIQYELSDNMICSDQIQVWYRDQNAVVDPREMVFNRLNNLRELLRVLAGIVQKGYTHYAANPRDRSTTTQAYDDYSTPHRVMRLTQMIEELQRLCQQYNIPWDSVEQQMATVTVPVGEGLTTDMRSIAYRAQIGALSSEPWDSIERRWGLDTPVPPIGTPWPKMAGAAATPGVRQPDLARMPLPAIQFEPAPQSGGNPLLGGGLLQ